MRTKETDKYRVGIGEVGEVDRRETPYRKMVELACRKAVEETCLPIPLPKELNPGIAFFTLKGEQWPYTWRAMAASKDRVRPTQFEGIIHNSAPGFAAIQLGLTGPQFALVGGDARAVAETQLKVGRSKFMLVCHADLESAECYALEVVE